MSDALPQRAPDQRNAYEVRTPATLYVPTDKLLPMAGGQDAPLPSPTCDLAFRQTACVTGQVTTNVVASCRTKSFCISSGIGPFACPPSEPCGFKFFANLCVEVDVTLSADAVCELTNVACGRAEEGPCLPTTPS